MIKTLIVMLEQSTDLLYENDKYLIKNSIHEQDISHRIAFYLENKLRSYNWFIEKGYSVDVEYNKNFNDSKNVYDSCVRCEEGFCAIRANTYDISSHSSDCRPDIIIHERGSDNNILVIEIKKDTNEAKKDFAKLSAFTCPKNKYKYGVGIFVNIRKNSTAQYRYFIDGQEVSKNKII